MNRLWYTDGTDRQQWEQRKDIPCRMAMLEEDYRMLMGRVMDIAAGVRYFNLKGEQDGYWRELLRYQPLVILVEISRMDVKRLEDDFLRKCRYVPRALVPMLEGMTGQLEDWKQRLIHYPRLQLTQDLSSGTELRLPEEPSDVEGLKRLFYSLLETVRKLQIRFDVYLQEIRKCGENDPALALLDVFLRHYGEIAARFNACWKEWPSFYFQHVLHAVCRGIVPDHTWLTFEKVPGAGNVIVPEGTAFVAGKNGDGTPVCYRSTEEIPVNEIRLEKIKSFFLEKDPERYPAAHLNFVTAVSENKIDTDWTGKPRKLFVDSDSARLALGLMVESPMLLVREGKRMLTVGFGLTEESRGYFQRLLADLRKDSGGREEEETNKFLIHKLLKDAFLLGITTEEGWKRIPDYTVTFREDGFIMFVFCLNRDFPATIRAEEDIHGFGSVWPVLKIVMNPEAWLFPYSWMNNVACEKVRLHVEVEGSTVVDVYGNIGELDISAPFYPFGVQAARGAQMVFGSYEMASKPLQKVKLACMWSQLPTGPEGLYSYYREYKQEIDNRSFRIRTEWLEGKKWKTNAKEFQYLFCPPDKHILKATGPLPEETSWYWYPAGSMSVVQGEEERFRYGDTGSGFFRVVLEEPDIGFGHSLYPRLFAEVMIANSRRKAPLPLPEPPLSPLLESLEVSYEAEEELCFAAGSLQGASRLFYMDPMDTSVRELIGCEKPFYMFRDLGGTGNVMLGFSGMLGCDRIRFFVDIAAIRQEVDLGSGGQNRMELSYSVKQGKSWCLLDAEVLVKDGTEGFMNSGLIELLLPCRVPEDWLDKDGLLWICIRSDTDFIKQIAVTGFYMNVVEVFLDASTVGEGTMWKEVLPPGKIKETVKKIPGIAGIRQITVSKGGRKKEDKENLKIRMIHRIRHRHRAVTPSDYEDLVLENFPQVAKVKCLPGIDSKGTARSRIVTLVVIPKSDSVGYPLSTHDLLLEIERFIQPLSGIFAWVDAINPLYEELTVRGCIGIEPGWSAGETIFRLRKKIDGLIAPWKEGRGLPVFGYRFGMQELRNIVMEDSGVSVLHGLSVVQVCQEEKRLYHLNEYGEEQDDLIGASCVWGIPVPADVHLIRTEREGEWKPKTGIGEMGIGGIFVVEE